jgi:hypothetical protein
VLLAEPQRLAKRTLCVGRTHLTHKTLPPPAPPTPSLEKGTTYNSYLIFGADYTALVDASHEKFSRLYIKVGGFGGLGGWGWGAGGGWGRGG